MNKIGSKNFTFFLATFLGLLFVFNFINCSRGIFTEKEGFIKLSSFQEKRLVKRFDLSSQNIESWEEMEEPLQRSLEYVSAKKRDALALDKYGLKITWGELQDTIKKVLRILPELDRRPGLLAKEFDWYELRPEPLITGYYEPQIKASLSPREGYDCPIYGLPEDLKTVDLGMFHPRWEGQTLVYRLENGTINPYYTREKIRDQNVLEEEAPVIAWAKKPLDVFYLQIQGSGRLVLPDGDEQFIGYAGKNGRKYVSIGRTLVENEYLEWEDLSMQSIRDVLNKNPEIKSEILNQNPSFVFFQLREDGPYGSMGRKLTPMASVAVDPDVLPLGSLLALNVDLPDKEDSTPELKGFGLAQDEGGVIKGHHLDLFCGTGEEAKNLAGRMKKKGKIYLMLDARD